MRLVTQDPEKYEAIPGAESFILFATGDGRHEDRVCRGFSDRFNGDKISIFSFKSPLPRRITGLDSLIVVRTYIEKFRVKRLLWTCDKEHFNARDKWISQINNKLTNLGMTANLTSEWNDGARLEVTLGPNNAVLWCALTGITKNLEENLSELINLELQETVGPDKKEILSALRRKGLKIEDLVKAASKEQLKRATPSLFSIFEDIERYYATS